MAVRETTVVGAALSSWSLKMRCARDDGGKYDVYHSRIVEPSAGVAGPRGGAGIGDPF